MTGAERHFTHNNLSMERMLAFLKGDLSKEETEEIERLIQHNTLYEKALDELKLSLSEDSETETKAIAYRDVFVDQVWQKSKVQVANHKKPNDRWHLWSMAAMILLLILPFMYRIVQPSVEDQIKETYFTSLEIPNVKGMLRGGENTSLEGEQLEIDELFQFANVAYAQAGDDAYSPEEQQQYYEIAIREYKKILAYSADKIPTKINLASNMYIAVSYLFVGHAAQALPHLERLIDHGDHGFMADAHWYRGWALLELEQREAAIDQFYLLAHQEGGKHQQAAKEIVQKLN